MTQVKANYKNGHQNLTCRACTQAEETQQHVINECQTLKDASNSTDENALEETEKQNNNLDPFHENPDTLRKTAKNIHDILENLNKFCVK